MMCNLTGRMDIRLKDYKIEKGGWKGWMEKVAL